MNIRHLLDTRLTAALHNLGNLPAALTAVVKPAARPEFGDYQANGIMAAAKYLQTKPRDLAERLLAQEPLSDLAQVEVAGPGFINIRLHQAWLVKALPTVTLPSNPAPQTVVVDYSGPNLAKEMHVGHLRSTIIGDAVARVLAYQGHRVVRQNHVGDWGTQFGMLIAYMVELQVQGNDLPLQLADLESFYRDAKQRFDTDATFADRARAYVVRLQSGDADCLRLWQQFIDISLQHCEAVYHQLGVSLSRQDVMPESAYNADLPGVVDDLQAAGLLVEDQGARCVFLDEFRNKDGSITPIIVQKSDGGYLYATTDLAALRHRSRTLHANRVLYFTDARQSLHFQQVFTLARKAGFVQQHIALEHMPFGNMLGENGKPFKTRTGGTVKLVELLHEAEQRAFALVSTKNPELPEAERRMIAHTVGIGAVKYADLSKNRNSDYVFSWETMLSFEGNTAPYLQYAYARIQSIFRKAGLDHATFDEAGNVILEEATERALALKIVQFVEAIDTVAQEGMPHHLCTYLYDLAGCFMAFYEACPMLRADIAQDNRTSRLQLAALTAQVLQRGLDLLGIGVMERM